MGFFLWGMLRRRGSRRRSDDMRDDELDLLCLGFDLDIRASRA